jgi:hypothetical protein
MSSELVPVRKRTLTKIEFAELADVAPEVEWLANITNVKTRRAYKVDVSEFSSFSGLTDPVQLRTVTRAPVIAWREDMEARFLSPASVRRKLSALSSLFDPLCERNAVLGNPVDGVKRPLSNNNVHVNTRVWPFVLYGIVLVVVSRSVRVSALPWVSYTNVLVRPGVTI